MGAFNLGPLALPAGPLLLLGAYIVASLIARWVDRARQSTVDALLWRILLLGVVIARAAFVARYFDSYRNSPWTIVNIRDGGFSIIAGVLAAVVLTAWYAWKRQVLRKPLLASTLAGASVWIAGMAFISAAEVKPVPLPSLELTTLDGKPVQLSSLVGRPVVLNLWATWCPPCRHEMPILRDAQVQHQDVTFVFANQGEPPEAIRSYLATNNLNLQHVLLDSRLQLGNLMNSRMLPTTFFFDQKGMLADRRIGELSAATLEEKLTALRGRSK